MICFLTSKALDYESLSLNPKNDFVNLLKTHIPKVISALFITAAPLDVEFTEKYASDVKIAFEKEGFEFTSYEFLDNRNKEKVVDLVDRAQLIFLAGGHVPTQNAFFKEIGLADLLKGTDKIVFGMSAGSMNAASLVYAQPEEDGEVLDKHYQRFLSGLGLTDTILIPHYQETKDNLLDGLKIWQDVTFPDSLGRVFYVLTDGAYLLCHNGEEILYGEAYRLSNANLEQVSFEQGSYRLK